MRRSDGIGIITSTPSDVGCVEGVVETLLLHSNNLLVASAIVSDENLRQRSKDIINGLNESLEQYKSKKR
jgi:hypothetical protein